jgi:protein tyrosine phosphatase (PTP) superfamily phosphohydrolase (DUF442 family)
MLDYSGSSIVLPRKNNRMRVPMKISKVLPLLMTLMIPGLADAKIERFFRVSKNVYRGSQPTEPADYAALRELGIKTIVNLRNDGMFEKNVAEQYGFRFLMFPMSAWTYPKENLVNGALEALRDERNGPVFVHCLVGKDRTGLIVALYRVLDQGWTPTRAYYEWVDFGFNRIFIQLLYYFDKRTRGVLPSGYHMPSLQADPIAVGNLDYFSGN